MTNGTASMDKFRQNLRDGRLVDVITNRAAQMRARSQEMVAESPNILFRLIHTWKSKNALLGVETDARIERVRHELAHDAVRHNINAKDGRGKTALHYAIDYGQYSAARLLVEAGADPLGDDHESPVRDAFVRPNMRPDDAHCRFARWLLEHLVSKGAKDRAVGQLTEAPSIIYLLAREKREQATAIKMLLAFGVPPHETAITRDGYLARSALHLAVSKAHFDVVVALLDAGADIDAKDMPNNCAPLSLAAKRGHDDIVTLLLSRGATAGGHHKKHKRR